MTVSVTNVYDGPYTCNGVATVYPFSFSCGGVDEVRVWADYVALSAGFTVSVNANQRDNPGGSVTFATPPANGVKLLIWSNPTFLQETSFRDAGQFLASSHDDALDDAARRDLYLLDAFNRMAKVPIGETLNDFPPYAQRAGNQLFSRVSELTERYAAISERLQAQGLSGRRVAGLFRTPSTRSSARTASTCPTPAMRRGRSPRRRPVMPAAQAISGVSCTALTTMALTARQMR
jgi:hypothetical protein